MIKNDERLFYICSPLSAPTQELIEINMKAASKYADDISQITGCRTIAPHSFLPYYLNDNIEREREVALSFGLEVIKICTGLYVCGNKVSKGMATEIAYAQSLGITIFKYDPQTETISKYFKNNNFALAI